VRLTCVPDSRVYELYINVLFSITTSQFICAEETLFTEETKHPNISSPGQEYPYICIQGLVRLVTSKGKYFRHFSDTICLSLQCSLVLNNWCKGCIHKTFIRPRHCIISRTNTIRPLWKEVKHEENVFFCVPRHQNSLYWATLIASYGYYLENGGLVSE
jgi:hypothetical protein